MRQQQFRYIRAPRKGLYQGRTVGGLSGRRVGACQEAHADVNAGSCAQEGHDQVFAIVTHGLHDYLRIRVQGFTHIRALRKHWENPFGLMLNGFK